YFNGSSYVNVAINPEDTITSLINKLQGIPITFDNNNHRLEIGGSSNTWIQSIDLELANILGIGAGEDDSYNSVFDPIEESTHLSELGLSAYTNYYIDFATGDGVGDNAKHIQVTGNDTIQTLMDKIDDIEGCSTSLNNGIFTINHGTNWAVTDISSELANALHLNIGEGINHQVSITSHVVNENTTLEQLNMVGNSATIETDSNTITVHPTDTIGDINEALGANYTLGVDSQGRICLSATEGHYITGMSSNLAAALGLEVGYGSSYSVDIQEGSYTTTTRTATNETTLEQLGLDHSTYIETDEGVFYINNTNTMEDLANIITNDIHISASYNEDTGIFTIGSDTDEHYVVNMSPELASILGNINVGNHFTYHITENEIEEEHTAITYQSIIGSDTFGTLGVTGTNYITLGDGDRVTITSSTTFGEFVENMNGKGFNVSLVNGIFNIQSNGNYIESDDNHILNKLNILGSTYTTTENTLGETKLKDLKDSEGNSLNISSGTINVIKNGISSTISINNNSTLDELANLLSNYNIQMDYGSGNSGHITFTGTGDSYLQERSASGATNLLTKLGVTDWSKIKNSESEKLEYTTNDNETIKLSTKLVNLKDSDGNSMGVTEGKYRIVAEGIHYEGIVSSETTVEDFFADLSAYGITGTIRSNGQIILNTSNDNTYLETGNGEAGYSSIVDNVFADWSFGNIYIANPVDVTTVETSNMTSETHLKDIDQGTFKAGKFVVASNLDGTTISHDEDIILALDENATVGDFMSAISYYGFNSYVENGQLIVRNDGTHTLENFNIPSQASNVISLLGLDTSAWEQPGVYTGEEQSTDIYHTAYVAATRETLLSELRDDENNELNITTGEYYVYQNGIKHTLNLNSTNISIDNFINTLSTYGINAVFDTNGTQSTLKLIGSGDSYLETSSAPNASNVVDKLFNNDKSTLYKYEHYQQTTELVTTTAIASLATMVSDYDTEGSVSAGTLEVYVDGNHSQINITEYETFGSLLEKFERIGVTATLQDGVIRLETGNTAFSIDTANSTSNLLTNLGLIYNEDLGGFAASSAPVTQTVTIIEDRTLSVANYADGNTQIGLLNITSGSLSIYRNGQKGVVMIDNTEDFNALQTKIHNEFSDINIDFQDGKLRFYSTTEGVDVQVGSSSDSSNISSICGFSENENGDIISARELYKVNASSKITTAGIFRNGTVREGTFIVGDAEFNITSDTTIQNIVAQINSSDKSNASAYWDSVDGKLVIASRTTGAAMVNIEAGTSNFTDIIGLTQSEWNASNEVTSTRILRDSQEIGKNAQFTINGTSFSSSSNVISSDVSRIQGLTLNLKNATAGEEVVVQVEQDKEAVSEAMNEFVDSYNELVENLDKELSSTGALSDQNTLKFIKQQIRNLLTNSFGSGTTFTNLSSLGISTSGANAANAGSTSATNVQFLYFDADKFLEGYSKDAEAVKNMLVGTDATPGILLQIDGIVSNALATGTGYFSNAEKSYQQKISDINEKIKKANASIEAYRARLENKFQSMDLLISQMQNQYNSFLSGGMQSINTSSSGAISYF
ncbi:MAG: flagellar filament capping protein FliD, partial [bacterium]|nr:flagellar filament capping protein FliD [bacterium]